MSQAAWQKGAAALTLIGFTGIVGLGCPAKELEIEIGVRGSAFLKLACQEGSACVALKSEKVCRSAKNCMFRNGSCGGNCVLEGNPAYEVAAVKELQILLFSSNPASLRKKSRCVRVDALACDSEAEPLVCSAKELNRAVAQALEGEELTFPGLEEPSQSFSVIAVFQPEGAEMNDKPSCNLERLVACAGLDVPRNEERLDIQCASCQGGLHRPLGENTRPCPFDVGGSDCFLQKCFQVLEAN